MRADYLLKMLKKEQENQDTAKAGDEVITDLQAIHLIAFRNNTT